MSSIKINIEKWYALSPGLSSNDAWRDWSKADKQWPDELLPVPVNLIKPMIRRRLSFLSKLALQSALQVAVDQQIDYIIFSSRHGELTRTVKLIKEIMEGEDASPIAFSQSVHNTASGLFTILTNRAVPVVSVSAIEGPFTSAFVEASIYLHENPADKVLLVDFDEPLPAPYQSQEERGYLNYHGYALSMILSVGDNVTISWSPAKTESLVNYPLAFELIDFLLNDEKERRVAGKKLLYSLEKK
jgi:hypothetical protein